MKITSTCLPLVILVICSGAANAAAECVLRTFMVGLDSSSFPCPTPENCTNVTINSFSGRHEPLYINCGNRFIFQSGIHRLEGDLPLKSREHLTLEGEGNTTIVCLPLHNVVTISLIAGVNITVKDLTFYNNCKIAVSSPVVHFTNMFLNQSRLILNKQSSVPSLLVQGSSTAALTCNDATVDISVGSQTNVSISNVRFLNCDRVNLISKSMSASAQIHKARFYNSCLRFVAKRTRSTSHNVTLFINKTEFERCVCHSVELDSDPNNIHFRIVLNSVTVTDNHAPFLEVRNKAVCILVTESVRLSSKHEPGIEFGQCYNFFYRNKC